MSINDYLANIESLIRASSVVATYSLTIDKKTEDMIFISGRLDFRDESVLDFKEFVEETDSGLVKLMSVRFSFENERLLMARGCPKRVVNRT
ncbi:MAG: hypothetical protein D6743_15300 [Calditrichaeota bacterium]|nr:MAG: hypothetical protein D6743_15300 [Calditrichota bacterium]